MSDGNPVPEKQPPRRYPPIGREEIEEWRQVPGPEKVLIGLRLQEMARLITLAGIRHQHPEADDAEIQRLYEERMERLDALGLL